MMDPAYLTWKKRCAPTAAYWPCPVVSYGHGDSFEEQHGEHKRVINKYSKAPTSIDGPAQWTTEDFELQISSTLQVLHIMRRSTTSSNMTQTSMQLGDTTPVDLHKQALVKTLRTPYPFRMVPTGQWDHTLCQGMDMSLLWDNIYPTHLYRVWQGHQWAHSSLFSLCG